MFFRMSAMFSFLLMTQWNIWLVLNPVKMAFLFVLTHLPFSAKTDSSVLVTSICERAAYSNPWATEIWSYKFPDLIASDSLLSSSFSDASTPVIRFRCSFSATVIFTCSVRNFSRSFLCHSACFFCSAAMRRFLRSSCFRFCSSFSFFSCNFSNVLIMAY